MGIPVTPANPGSGPGQAPVSSHSSNELDAAVTIDLGLVSEYVGGLARSIN